MAEAIEGSCLCGAVAFRISGRFDGFYLCHCSRCRKDTGSAHAANMFSSTATIEWLSGQDKVRTYSVPGTRHQKSFCTECGSAMPRAHPDGSIATPAGCLDGEIGIRPDAHIFWASRADWDDRLEEVPRRNRFSD